MLIIKKFGVVFFFGFVFWINRIKKIHYEAPEKNEQAAHKGTHTKMASNFSSVLTSDFSS